jgi:alkaline phosphatase D
VGTSISSGFPADIIPAVAAALPDNPHVKDFDGLLRGYVVTRVDRSEWRSDYRVVATVDLPVSPAFVRRSWTVSDGVPGANPS